MGTAKSFLKSTTLRQYQVVTATEVMYLSKWYIKVMYLSN